jgi:hypothetical protein
MEFYRGRVTPQVGIRVVMEETPFYFGKASLYLPRKERYIPLPSLPPEYLLPLPSLVCFVCCLLSSLSFAKIGRHCTL